MKRIIAALTMSLDGYIEGPNGEIDWVDNWEDSYGIMSEVDACVLGGGMYPQYEQYWSAVSLAPNEPLPFTGKPATAGEISYAQYAIRTPHFVLSTRLEKAAWDNTRIVRSIDEIRALKLQDGKDIHAVGGAALVSTLLQEELVDELRLIIAPILLSAGKPLFKDITSRHQLKLTSSVAMPDGYAKLTYTTHPQ